MHLSSKFTEHVDILCECDSQSGHSVYAKLTEKYPISNNLYMYIYCIIGILCLYLKVVHYPQCWKYYTKLFAFTSQSARQTYVKYESIAKPMSTLHHVNAI